MKVTVDPVLHFEETNPKAMKYISVFMYLIFSIVSILFNKMLLTRVDNVGAYFLNFVQFSIESGIIIFIMSLDKWIFHPFDFDFQKCLKVIPTVLTFTATALLNNMTLALCPMATYQVVKSLTPLINIIIMFFVFKKKTTKSALLCCIGIIIGFTLGMVGDKSYRSQLKNSYPQIWPYLGVTLGVLSSVAMALFSILSKNCIALFNGNQWQFLQYLIPLTAITFAFISYLTGDINMVVNYPHDRKFYLLHMLGGIFLTLLNFSAFLCLRHTSPLTHNVTSIVVTTLTTIISYFFVSPREKMTFLKVVGIVVIVACSLLYALLQPPQTEEIIENTIPENLQSSDSNEDSVAHFDEAQETEQNI